MILRVDGHQKLNRKLTRQRQKRDAEPPFYRSLVCSSHRSSSFLELRNRTVCQQCACCFAGPPSSKGRAYGKSFPTLLFHPASPSKRRILKATKAVQEDVGMFVMQSELNDVFVGPIFNFTVRRDTVPFGMVSYEWMGWDGTRTKPRVWHKECNGRWPQTRRIVQDMLHEYLISAYLLPSDNVYACVDICSRRWSRMLACGGSLSRLRLGIHIPCALVV